MTRAPNPLPDHFSLHFGQLVGLLRSRPGDSAAQKASLRAAMAILPHGSVDIDAGIEHSEVPDDLSLQGRLLFRQIDSIHFSEDASAAEVLNVARSLAGDQGDIPSHDRISIRRLQPSGVRSDLHPASGETPVAPTPLPPAQRHRTMAGPVAESDRITRSLNQYVHEGQWLEAVHAGQALVRLLPLFPEHEQRAHLLTCRRVLTRALIQQFIEFAIRVAEEQDRVSEILRHTGPEGIELMVDCIREGEVIGPRRFVHNVLATMPAALPLLLPLLQSSRWHEVRHGAELLGWLGAAEAIEPLRATLTHPDDRVRAAVIEALGRFSQASVIEPLRRALSDPSPAARGSAAYALAQRHSAGLALPLLVALETEKDPAAWDALVRALASIDSNESGMALMHMALDTPKLLRPGRSMSQRLSIVRALGDVTTRASRRALERLAAEGPGQVRQAASAALEQRAVN